LVFTSSDDDFANPSPRSSSVVGVVTEGMRPAAKKRKLQTRKSSQGGGGGSSSSRGGSQDLEDELARPRKKRSLPSHRNTATPEYSGGYTTSQTQELHKKAERKSSWCSPLPTRLGFSEPDLATSFSLITGDAVNLDAWDLFDSDDSAEESVSDQVHRHPTRGKVHLEQQIRALVGSKEPVCGLPDHAALPSARLDELSESLTAYFEVCANDAEDFQAHDSNPSTLSFQERYASFFFTSAGSSEDARQLLSDFALCNGSSH
jgi:hypothetical protein